MITRPRPSDADEPTGVIAFSGLMLAAAGILQVLQGVAAIAQDQVLASGPKQSLQMDVTTWGWVHVGLGALAVLVAVGILLNQAGAAGAGILVAAAGCVVNFLFLPYYPWWALTLIVTNLLVVWALSLQLDPVHR
ncbi:DUF7144 family membrane protein [Aeromicrobium massiliense]|uniref:DUF7144 family membrane protein n=1 Tax=Aeromicrobium massiliense TaxID=1464554 RepID=UPI0002E67FAA|nr:hypothetical protein [Aeromicrobium massiliense]